MKFKRTTIARYHKWKQTAKKSDKFMSDHVAYTQNEFEKLIGLAPQVAHVAPEAINTIVEQHDEDLEPTLHTGHTEEPGE